MTTLRSLKGQAMIELAVMGGITLIALSLLLRMGLQMNYQVELEQNTFRRALRAADMEQDDKSSPSVTYVHIRDRVVPDPSQGPGMAPRLQTQASGFATWSKWLTLLGDEGDSEPRTVVDVNWNNGLYGATGEARSGDIVNGDAGGSLIRSIESKRASGFLGTGPGLERTIEQTRKDHGAHQAIESTLTSETSDITFVVLNTASLGDVVAGAAEPFNCCFKPPKPSKPEGEWICGNVNVAACHE